MSQVLFWRLNFITLRDTVGHNRAIKTQLKLVVLQSICLMYSLYTYYSK